jgi:hypothetical protein
VRGGANSESSMLGYTQKLWQSHRRAARGLAGARFIVPLQLGACGLFGRAAKIVGEAEAVV